MGITLLLSAMPQADKQKAKQRLCANHMNGALSLPPPLTPGWHCLKAIGERHDEVVHQVEAPLEVFGMAPGLCGQTSDVAEVVGEHGPVEGPCAFQLLRGPMKQLSPQSVGP